ncbi:MAG: dihydrolipoamide acetyltransferase family protein [Acidimicrobiales bacterium]
MADITMPQLGETVTEGTITKWFKQVGDQIAEDEVLFEVSTDKVDSEVPSPVAGYVTEILVGEGVTVPVGSRLAVIGDQPGDGGDGGGDGVEAEAEPEAKTEPEPEPEEAEAEPEPEKEPEAEPRAEAEPPKQERPSTDGRLLSPVVRRLIAEHNLDPGEIQGTGAGGRITRNDVLSVIEARGPAEAPKAEEPKPEAPKPEKAPAAKAEPATAPAPAPVTVAAAGERDTSIAHSNIRRRTAEHMVRSKATSAHVYASIEVDFEAVERVRQAQKEAWRAAEGFGLTYLPFIVRAVCDAIEEYREVNATFGENELIVHHYVNLGVAVDMDFKGLIVPVIHDADGKRLRAIAREIADLAARARSKKLSADEISGGTFTITNPGPFGTTMTLPIINQPQVAILSTDGVRRRPVVIELPDGSEGIGIHSVGNVTLAWDHRAFDGAYAASFLAKLKDTIETREWVAEV